MNFSDVLRIAGKLGTLTVLLVLLFQIKKKRKRLIAKQNQARSACNV